MQHQKLRFASILNQSCIKPYLTIQQGAVVRRSTLTRDYTTGIPVVRGNLILCSSRLLSLSTCPPGKLSPIQCNVNVRYENLKPPKIIETGQVEECFGQVGREVHLADGQVEIFF